jgi:NDP-hexose C3-ketoreductase / dTDP-4-oxo-2-deoxy-alpha-D-pentos-2-ene 2,3-reductase
MKYSFMGASNLQVSRICLGTMHFGSSAPKAEAMRIMDKALELGINFFDTANVYGRSAGTGASESIIGEWFASGGNRRDSVVLSTKVFGDMTRGGAVPPNEGRGLSAYKIRRQAVDSLRRLRTDHIDLYIAHHIDRRMTGEEFWEGFERLQDKGDILYVGTSNFPGWGLAKMQCMARQRGRLGIVSEQCQYNLLSRYPELEVIPAAREFGIGIMVYMPVAGGLLTGKAKAEPGSRTAEVEREYGLPLGKYQPLQEFTKLCAKIGRKEAVVAIAWVLANPAVYTAVLGIRTVSQLDVVEEAASLSLDTETMAALDGIFSYSSGRPLGKGEAPEAFAW